MIVALLFFAQVAPDTPQRISILTPTCRPDASDTTDIVVCARSDGAARLPLPDERPPVGPLPIDPALMVDSSPRPSGGAPCAARLAGCAVGMNVALMPILDGAAGMAKRVLAKHPDKSGRVAIPLDDPPAPGVSMANSPRSGN